IAIIKSYNFNLSRHYRHGEAYEFLYVFQVFFLLVIAKRDGNTISTGTACSSNSVNVSFGNVREFVVYYVRQFVDIDSSGSDICSDKHSDTATFKVGQSFLSGEIGRAHV